MFKLKHSCIALLLTACTAANASTDTKSFTKGIFFGASFDRNYFSSKQTESDVGIAITPLSNADVNGYSLMVGKKWHNFGAQVGYSFLNNISVSSLSPLSSAKVKQYNMFIEGLLFYPVNTMFDLKAALGLGLMHSSMNGTYSVFLGPSGSFNISQNQLSPRIGIGTEFKPGEHLSLDIMLRYQRTNFLYKNDAIFSVGAYYHL